MPVLFISLQLLLIIHAGSPNVTSLTFDNQSRTLTCTSTGGPATTVTWRRDGIVITRNATHQQTKRLVDSVTGTYQTVLTIEPSVGWSDIMGTYNCTVENVRGKSSETVVVPGETRTFACLRIHITLVDTYIPLCHRIVYCLKVNRKYIGNGLCCLVCIAEHLNHILGWD